MIKWRLAVFLLVIGVCAALGQSAPTNPPMTYGMVPTVGQWISWFQQKQDVLGSAPLTTAGGTMLGRLNLFPSSLARAGTNLGVGVTPTAPVDGDIWITASGAFTQVNGSTVSFGIPLGSGVGTLLSGVATGTGGPVGSIAPIFTGSPPTIPGLPIALNINSTFNGINYAGCTSSVSCTLYINGAPALGGSFGANPTVRIDRSPTGTGGTSSNDTFGLEVVLNAPATDSWTENAGFFILNNRAVIANGTESAALLAQAFKQGGAEVGATWAASFYAWDSTGVTPTNGHGLIGNEIGLAFGIPGAEVNAGTDPFVTRQILKLVCSGLSGTHCGQGESISAFFSGDVIDTGLCFGTGCNGGNGTFGVGINMTGVFSESAILFSALNQNGLGWTNTSGVYTPTSAGAQIYSDTSNNLDINNYNSSSSINLNIGASNLVSLASAGVTLPGLSGSGSRPACLTSTGKFEAGSVSSGLVTCP